MGEFEDEQHDGVGIGVEPAQRDALWEPEVFRRHSEVRYDASQMPIRPALTFTVVADHDRGSFDRDPLSSWWTWFAGSPVVRRGDQRPWPRAATGRPLAHVLQVDLSAEVHNLREPVFSHVDLPPTGVFQLFHDLVTYGDSEDAGAGAWHVRWIAKSDDDEGKFVLQEPPSDLGLEDEFDKRVAAVPLNTEVVATIPPFLNLPTEFEDPERYERVYYWLEEYPHQTNMMRRGCDDNPLSPWQEGYEPSDAASRMRGYGFVEDNPDYGQVLETTLPLAPGDTHELLLELNPAQMDAPADWFHGLRPLQVWIRASDLAARNFDDVWCQIRTDA